MKTSLPDGTYQVSTSYFTAGFVVQDGEILDFAPILRRRLAYWVTVAKRVS